MFGIDDIAIALAISAAASAVASGVGSANASAAQKDAAQKAMDLQKQIWDQQREDQAPWRAAGQTSLADMLRMTQGGYDTSQLANDPGYQFRMAEGQKALERSASARGLLNSGGALKSLARYSQGVASDEFGNRFNRLASIAGLGQTATQNTGAMGSGYANNMGNLYGTMGSINSAGAMVGANAFSNGFQTLGGMAGMYGMYGGGGGYGYGGMGIPTQPGSMVSGRGTGWGPGTYGGGG